MCGWIVTTGGVKLDVALMAVVGVIMITVCISSMIMV